MTQNRSKQRILIVDDDEAVLKIMGVKLQESGYHVVTATTALSGLQKAKEEKVDLIILDLILPDRDGYQVLKELKSDVTTQHIPVVILTVKNSEEEVQQALDSGVEDYIAKPLQLPLLVLRIKNILSKGN